MIFAMDVVTGVVNIVVTIIGAVLLGYMFNKSREKT